MTHITVKQSKYDPIAAGKYVAKIGELEEESGDYGPQIKFNFDVLDPAGGANKAITGWCSMKFNPKTKLYLWMQVIMGDIPGDYEFDSDDVVGKKVYLNIIEVPGDNGVFNKIESIERFNDPAPEEEAVY